MKNQLRIGVVLTYINLAVGMIIPFWYTPIMLDMLGQSEYGLYSLSNSVVGYLSLLTFGFGSTIVRYLSKCRAEEDKEGIRAFFGFFLKLYSILAVAVMVCSVVIVFNVEAIFDQGLLPEEIAKMRILVLTMAFNVALSFPLSVYSAVTIAFEKYTFRKIVDSLPTIVLPLANLAALYLGYKSVGMAVSTVIVQCLFMPANIWYCSKVLRVKPKFCKMPTGLIKEMMGFTVFMFLGQIVDMLFWATDKVILGMLASTAAVAVYNVGCTFNTIVMSLSTSISGVLAPKLTIMVTKGTPKSEWTELFIRVGRLQFLIIGLVVSGFAVFGQSFIYLWAGEEYAEAFWVAVLTMFPLVIPLIQNTGLGFLIAQNKHRFRAIVYLVIAIANVISTYLLVPYMGVIGAALCSAISYIVGQGIIMNIYYHKVTGINIPLFWWNILKMALVPAGLMITGFVVKQFVSFDNWMAFLAGVAIFTVLYVVLMFTCVMNRYEKDIVLVPIKKGLSLLKKK